MTAHWVECRACGAKRDASNTFTSPANAKRDAAQWDAMHGSGMCSRDRENVTALAEQYRQSEREIEESLRKNRALQRAAAERLDELALAERPTYPTDAQREGIRLACALIREGEPSKSHHGDPCGPYGSERAVTVETQRRRINIYAGAPYAQANSVTRYVWHFTDDDIAALRAAVEAEGATIFSEWPHEDGWACIVGVES